MTYRNPDRECQAHGCGGRREIHLTRDRDGVTAEFCRTHAEGYGSNYEGQWNRGFTPKSLIPGLAICPRCGRYVMNNARHGYSMSWNGGDAACGE